MIFSTTKLREAVKEEVQRLKQMIERPTKAQLKGDGIKKSKGDMDLQEITELNIKIMIE